MTIEFRCPACEGLVSTTGDRAGESRICPHCGAMLPDVERSHEAITPELITPEETGNPYQSPVVIEDEPTAALQKMGGPIVPTKVPILDFYTRSARIFWNRPLSVIGLTLFYIILWYVCSAVEMAIVASLPLSSNSLVPLIRIGTNLFVLMLLPGYFMAMLKVCRGDRAGVGDLFWGKSYYLRMLGYAIVFWLIIALPYHIASTSSVYTYADNRLEYITHGILALVTLWMVCLWIGYGFLAIPDQNCRIFHALNISWRITSINTFRIGLAFILLASCQYAIEYVYYMAQSYPAYIPLAFQQFVYLGMVVFYLFIIVILLPYVMLFYIASYLQMSGQPLAYQPDGFVRHMPMPEADLNSGADTNPFAS